MAVIFSDQEIRELVEEPKRAPTDWHDRIRPARKRGHAEQHIAVISDAGNVFRVIIRLNMINHLDFSVILSVQIARSNMVFRLRRYNGKSHEHTNHIERLTFYDYHVHMATERYQRAGMKPDGYAEPTDRYSDLRGALKCLINDANVKLPSDLQGNLFEDQQQ